MTYLTLDKLIKFQNDLIFQHDGFINIDKKISRNLFKYKNEAIKRYYGDDF